MSKAVSRKRCKIRPRVQLMTNRKSYRRIQWYHSGPSRVTPDKGSGPQFGETVYISEVNGARTVKSNAQVDMNKNSNSVQKVFP